MSNPFRGARIAFLGGTGPLAKLIRRQLEEQCPSQLDLPTRDEMRLPDDTGKLSGDYDLLINFAALSRPAPANSKPKEALDTNFIGIQRLLARYRATDTKIVCASSVKTSCVESMYGWSKLAAEAAVAATDNVQATAIRFGNIVETAPSMAGIIQSIHTGQSRRGFIASSSEYYQTSDTVLDAVGAALSASAGSLVTPLLPSIPLVFVAGYLAARLESQGDVALSDWTPDYIQASSLSPLIPNWWLPYTTVMQATSLLPSHVTRSYLVTNFREKPLDSETVSRTREFIAEGVRAQFGPFAQELGRVLNRTHRAIAYSS